MSYSKQSVENASNLLRSQVERFRTLYSRGTEGILISTGQQVLLWTLRLRFSKPELIAEMYERIRVYIRSLSHLPVIDFGVDRRGVPYIITHWHSLESAMTKAKNHEQLPFIFWQMTSILSKLHAKDLPFGDISDDSFLVDPSGRVYLCGFPAYGFPVPKEGLNEGLQSFIAPEEAEQHPFSADVFALGAYAHLLFTRRPFPNLPSSTSISTHLQEKTLALLALYPDLPPYASKVLSACLTWKAEDRAPIETVSKLATAQVPFSKRFALRLSHLLSAPSLRFSIQARDSALNPGLRNSLLGALGAFLLLLALVSFWPKAKAPVPETLEVASSKTPVVEPAGSIAALKHAFTAPSSPGEELKTTSRAEKASNKKTKPDAKVGEASEVSTNEESTAIPDLILFAESEYANTVRQSVLSATPEPYLLKLLTRSGEIPHEQFVSAGRELLSRKSLDTAPRLALLTLLRLEPRDVRKEEREALLRVLSDSTLIQDLNTLANWRDEHGLLVLTAIIAESRSPDFIYTGFMALASMPTKLEPLDTLLSYAKTRGGIVSIEQMKAIAALALSDFTDQKQFESALNRLSKSTSRLELHFLLLAPNLFSMRADWCPLLVISGK